MSGPPTAADQINRPDPQQDRPVASANAPSRTGRLLGLVRKLIDYGKGLASALQQRASATNLAVITRNFGTTDIALIVAHITRALHCAVLLEARLLNRRIGQQADGPAPTSSPSRPALTSSLSPRQPRADRFADGSDPGLAHLPTVRDIAAEIRRRPVGAVLADICRDLGIVPSDPLWRELRLAIAEYGGNFAALFKDTYKRVSIAIFGPPAVESPAWPAPCPQSPAASGAGPP
jgi:hypothetical protein